MGLPTFATRMADAAALAAEADSRGYSVTLRLVPRGVLIQASRNFGQRTATVTFDDIAGPVDVLGSVLHRLLTDLPVMDWERQRGMHLPADAALPFVRCHAASHPAE